MQVIKHKRGKGVNRPLDAIRTQDNYEPWGSEKDIEKEATEKTGNSGGYKRTWLPEPQGKERDRVWQISVRDTSPWSKIDVLGMTFEQSTHFPITELGTQTKESVVLHVLSETQMTALQARLKDKAKKYEDNVEGETRIYTLDELVEIREVEVSPSDLESNIISLRDLSEYKTRPYRKEEVKK